MESLILQLELFTSNKEAQIIEIEQKLLSKLV